MNTQTSYTLASRPQNEGRVPTISQTIDEIVTLFAAQGFTVDLSRSGALLDVLTPAVDRDLNVTLSLPDGASPLRLIARPVRSTPQGIAVQFVDPSPEESRRLESLILTEKARALWAWLASTRPTVPG